MKQKSAPARMSTQARKYTMYGIIFALPWMIGFLAFTVYPIIASIVYSFTDFNGFAIKEFVGVENYVRFFTDEKSLKSLWNTLYMCVFSLPANIVFSLCMALLLSLNVKGQSVFRTIFYIPSVVSVVAASMVWVWVLNPSYGILNKFLMAIGVPASSVPGWMFDPNWTKPALILMGMWGSGGMMLIFLASIKGVPQSLYEAAELDGANAWKKFWHITMPGISPAMFYQLVTGIIGMFQYFTQAYIFSASSGNVSAQDGGPGNSMLFYALHLYNQAFKYMDMGFACAMAWILFIIIMIVTAIIFATSGWVQYGDGE